jgi:hypothetical protein
MSIAIITMLAVWQACDMFYAVTGNILISGVLGAMSVGALALSIEGLVK